MHLLLHSIKYIFFTPDIRKGTCLESHSCIITLYFILCCTFLEDLAHFIQITECFGFFFSNNRCISAVWTMTLHVWHGHFFNADVTIHLSSANTPVFRMGNRNKTIIKLDKVFHMKIYNEILVPIKNMIWYIQSLILWTSFSHLKLKFKKKSKFVLPLKR